MAVIDSTFGAALDGLIVSACLFGITLLQTFSYFRHYPKDKLYIKGLVILLTALDTIHLILCSRTIYWYLISNFGDTDNLDRITWSMALQTDCNGLIGLIVEVFFARRVWMMSKNWVITAIIVTLACLHFGQSHAPCHRPPQIPRTEWAPLASQASESDAESTLRLQWETCLGLGAAAVADVIIAASMCYYLRKKRTGLKRTDSVVSLLMVYSINSGLLTR
uniref:N/A n=1 Tax=Ganoderma boninense TaxID=34458 RepID=A0A5K1JZU5_9APHY|nr:N/A [Ganoderma boninense]